MKPPSLLSQQLSELCDTTQGYLHLLKEKLSKTQAITESIKSSLQEMNQKLNESQAIITAMRNNESSFRENMKKEKLMSTFKHQEKLELISKFKNETKARDRVMALYEDKAKLNEDLNDKTSQHSHNQLMITMKSAIVGERLKGLYDACLFVSYHVNLEEKFSFLFLATATQGKRLLMQVDRKMHHAENELPKIVQLMQGSASTFHKRNELLNDLKKLRSVVVNKIQNLDSSIVHSLEEGDVLLKSQSYVETKVQNFSEDFVRIKTKLTEISGQNKRNDAHAEKVCEFCGKGFLEIDNFHWSCRTHSGAWSGSMYWCCGKETKEAFGCRLQKHFCREESQLEENAEDETKKKSFCATCKSIGHPSTECHLDPNIRRNLDQHSTSQSKLPIEKIAEIYKKKRKPFKIKKKEEKVDDLRASLKQKNFYKSGKLKKFRTGALSLERNSSTVSSESPLFEHFPLISRRRGSIARTLAKADT